MTNFYKHVGEIANTAKKCAVVFLQLPDDPEHAVVIDTEALPDRYHQALMEVIQSKEGQTANSLADVLARRMLPDTGRTMLETFHNSGILQRVSIDNVNLLPQPNVKHSLRSVLEAMGKVIPNQDLNKANFYSEQGEIDKSSDKYQVAIGLVQQAELMEQDAGRLRERAYNLVPSLKTKPVSEVVKEAEQEAPQIDNVVTEPTTVDAVAAEVKQVQALVEEEVKEEVKPESKSKTTKK